VPGRELEPASKALRVRAPTADEWDVAWSRSPHATFFESRLWAELWFLYTAGRTEPAPKLISLDDDWSIVVPLSRARAARRLHCTYLLTPAGNYGGWLNLSGHLQPRHAGQLAAWITSSCESLIWRANPYDAIAMTAFPKTARDDTTESLSLDGGVDKVMDRWSRSHSEAVRRALKLGVVVRRGRSWSDWRSYYRLHQRSRERWGPQAKSHYEWRLFELLAALPSENVQLWIASRHGEDLAGLVCLCSTRCVVAWQSAAIPEAFPNGAAQATYCVAVRGAVDAHAEWFDFSPSHGLHDVQFERRCGSQSLPSPVKEMRPPWAKLAGDLKASLSTLRDSIHSDERGEQAVNEG